MYDIAYLIGRLVHYVLMTMPSLLLPLGVVLIAACIWDPLRFSAGSMRNGAYYAPYGTPVAIQKLQAFALIGVIASILFLFGLLLGAGLGALPQGLLDAAQCLLDDEGYGFSSGVQRR